MRSIHTAAFLFFLLLLPLSLKATSLASDFIYIDGERWNLLWKPIYEDSALAKRLIEFLPKERTVSTADVHGFTAHWIIKDGYLYLQKIEICRLDQGKEPLFFDVDELKEVFAPYYKHGRICARWFSGELRAGRGKIIRNQLLGFDRDQEEECIMKVKKGKIIRKRVYRN
ncbi:MAG: hypothetical protein Q4D36_04050 [Bacteroidales bacterium]|nr:hypothetical protein [Bacteroidales bacterium]